MNDVRVSRDEVLRDFGRRWELDGDLLRCRACGRAIIHSKRDQDMRHAHGCAQSAEIKPWAALEQALAQPSEQALEEYRKEAEQFVHHPLYDEQPSEPAKQVSYDICSHGVVGGCLRDDPAQPAELKNPAENLNSAGQIKAEQVGRDETVRDAVLEIERLYSEGSPSRMTIRRIIEAATTHPEAQVVAWRNPNDDPPQHGVEVLCRIRGVNSGRIRYAVLERVRADDHEWEMQGDEIANCWIVEGWRYPDSPANDEAVRCLQNAERELETLPDQVNVKEALAWVAKALESLASQQKGNG